MDIVLPLAQKLDPTDTAVVFTFCRLDPGSTTRTGLTPVVTIQDGYAPPEKMFEYLLNSARKAIALAEGHPNNVSSFQCRDTDAHVYGGAVSFLGCLFSFAPSGLAEHFDEMIACLVAYDLNITGIPQMRQAAGLSSNEHLLRYLDMLEAQQ